MCCSSCTTRRFPSDSDLLIKWEKWIHFVRYFQFGASHSKFIFNYTHLLCSEKYEFVIGRIEFISNLYQYVQQIVYTFILTCIEKFSIVFLCNGWALYQHTNNFHLLPNAVFTTKCNLNVNYIFHIKRIEKRLNSGDDCYHSAVKQRKNWRI
jgi:hypothetical protein